MAIPVIDFSKTEGEERETTLAQIAHCCEQWGFFQLINHGISEELLKRVKKVASECYKVEREPVFQLSTPVKKLKELLEKQSDERVEDVDWEDVLLLTDDNADEWPSKTAGFKVMETMDETLGLPKGYMKSAFNGGEGKNEAFFGTKVSHYPPCPHPERVNALRAHTDAGGVILLFQDDEVEALQVLKDGVWIDVQPLKNAIVINTGDQVEVLSNGRYKSAWHRIVAKQEGNRRSIASFYNPSMKATIEPATKLLVDRVEEVKGDEAHEYPKFVFGDYMSVYAEQKFMPKEPRFQAVKAV